MTRFQFPRQRFNNRSYQLICYDRIWFRFHSKGIDSLLDDMSESAMMQYKFDSSKATIRCLMIDRNLLTERIRFDFCSHGNDVICKSDTVRHSVSYMETPILASLHISCVSHSDNNQFMVVASTLLSRCLLPGCVHPNRPIFTPPTRCPQFSTVVNWRDL